MWSVKFVKENNHNEMNLRRSNFLSYCTFLIYSS
jgi:hypothetical protein